MSSLYLQRCLKKQAESETSQNSILNDQIIDMCRSEIFKRTNQENPEILQDLTRHKDEIRQLARDILEEKYPTAGIGQITEVLDQLTNDIYGFGPVSPLLERKDMKNIWINRHDRIMYEDSTGRHLWSHTFRSEQHLRRTAENMAKSVGRKVDESFPSVDCRLVDGSRVSIVLGRSPAVRGTSITIRRFPQLFTLEELSEKGSFPESLIPLFKLMVKARLNVFTAGAMGSGKNTFLSALLLNVGKEENLIFVEDPAESLVGIPDPQRPDLPVPFVKVYEPRPANVEGRGAVTLEELFERSLRQQPDRLLVSECRSYVTAHYTLMAMNIGHPGSMSSVHSNNTIEVPKRLATLLGDQNRENLLRTTAINIIIFLGGLKMADGYPTYHRVLDIAEVASKGDGMPEVHNLYTYDFEGYTDKGEPIGKWKSNGRQPEFLNHRQLKFVLSEKEYRQFKDFFQERVWT